MKWGKKNVRGVGDGQRPTGELPASQIRLVTSKDDGRIEAIWPDKTGANRRTETDDR